MNLSNSKNILKDILKIILTFIIILVILMTALVIVNLIPKKYIKDNVKESIEIFKNEGYYPRVESAHKFLLDNWTDANMLNIAYSIDNENPIESTILMRIGYRANENLPIEEIGDNDKPIQNLIENVNETNTIVTRYSRYWHGYLIYLRPLLSMFNYQQIRVIFVILISMLSILLVYFVYKKLGIKTAIATILMLILYNYWAVGLSLLYSNIFIITLISSLYIVIRDKKIKNIGIVFFIIGMITSFTDLLTTPLLTLGIPLIFWIVQNKEQVKLKEVFKIMLLWGFGYASMWISKWIIADLIYNTGTIKNAIGKIFAWTSNTKDINKNILEVIKINISYLLEPIIFFITTTVITLILCKAKGIKKNIPLIIIAILPFIWFCIVKNHSYIHSRFVFRNLLLTVFVLVIITLDNIEAFIKSSSKKKTQLSN